MGTRPGVELNERATHRLNPSTGKQKELIAELERLIPDFKTYFEFEDYQKNPTVENASALITAAQEYNLDLFSTKENLVEYMGKRPGAVREGEHGLFSGRGEVDLRAAMSEVANHPGNVWTHIVSLRREDAERLGYNSQRVWRDLAVSQIAEISKAMKIPIGQLRWYAAFHNCDHHPHMHMVIFSKDARSGYLSKKGIDKIRSGFAHEIFKQDFYQIYKRKQVFDNDLTRYGRERMESLIAGLNNDRSSHPELEGLLTDLSAGLQNHKGKKVYGFLKPELKAKVDAIVRALASDPRIAELYRGWCECQNEIIKTYKFDVDDPPPLEKQPAFRSIHNAVIKAAGQLNTGQPSQAAPAQITAPDPDGDFLLSKSKPEREGEPHAPQEQERAEETVLHPPSSAQAEAPAETRSQTQSPASHSAREYDRQALTGPAALAVNRLLRSLGSNVYNSYMNGHDRLFLQADRKQLRKQAQKKTAQGHQLDDHEQEQTQY
jgi:hypothetical protein